MAAEAGRHQDGQLQPGLPGAMEVVPFWVLAFLGLAFATWAADLGSTLAGQADASHAVTTAVVMGSSLLAFGVLWVGKFAIFNALLFAERQHGGDEART